MGESSSGLPLESIETDWILVRRAKEHPKQESLAHAAGLDPSMLSNFINNKGAVKISNLKLLLRALNLKLVHADSKCVRESAFRELTSLAARALQEQPQLLWEENE